MWVTHKCPLAPTLPALGHRYISDDGCKGRDSRKETKRKCCRGTGGSANNRSPKSGLDAKIRLQVQENDQAGVGTCVRPPIQV